MGQIRARARVTGTVQGVFFRDATRTLARELGVTGRVRNLPDGGVEVLAEGEENAVRRLVAWCHDGPPRARVQHVDVEWGAATGEFNRFDIAR